MTNKRGRLNIGAAITAAVLAASCGSSSSTPVAIASPTPSPTTHLAISPLARGYHHMLATPFGVLLFSGETAPPRGGGYLLGDVWIYHHNTGWTSARSNGQKDGTTAYDPESARMVAFVDSQDKFEPVAETWLYDPKTDLWQQQARGTRPDPLGNSVTAAYDVKAGRVVIYGANGETWSYDVKTNAWRNMRPATSPDAHDYPAMDYDPESGRIIFFGGGLADVGTDQTWAYDYAANRWTKLNPSTHPPARQHGTMVYDPRGHRFILFGGETYQIRHSLNDTWAYDPRQNTWTNLSPANSPSPRARQAMAYDAETGTIVMFGGGSNPFHFLADTWTYDPAKNTWALQ